VADKEALKSLNGMLGESGWREIDEDYCTITSGTPKMHFPSPRLEKYRGSAKVAVSGNSRSLSGLFHWQENT
jgi:hypothetical protein